MKNFNFLLIVIMILFFSNCKKEEKIEILNDITDAKFNENLSYRNVYDIDRNVYKTIKIGTQTWMAENLRTTHYRNGDPIEYIENDKNWTTVTEGAYCNYENTKDVKVIASRGRLYNWFSVDDDRNIAPCGWHVPSDEEWNILINYLGGDSIAGGKLKEEGVIHWMAENVGANNESGFTALPAGYRDQYNGIFDGQENNGFWWTSTEDSNTHSWYRYLNHQLSSVGRFSWDVGNKNSGFSVRCIRDY